MTKKCYALLLVVPLMAFGRQGPKYCPDTGIITGGGDIACDQKTGKWVSCLGEHPPDTCNQIVQVPYMVWDAGCINKIEVGKNTRMEAPMKDGEPDMTRVMIYKEIANVNKLCGHIEIRRENAREIRSDKSKAEE
jgi:hypothetical protein